MDCTYRVPCSNCGRTATRSYFISREPRYARCPKERVIHTECPHCDYLMVMCSLNGRVIEAHDSSTSAINQDNQPGSMQLPEKLSA